MTKESIQELANQLGKSVNWISDNLLPYMYNYAEYKVIICIIFAVTGLLMLISLPFVNKFIDYNDLDLKWFINALFISLGIILLIIGINGALSWWIAPEITFINCIQGV